MRFACEKAKTLATEYELAKVFLCHYVSWRLPILRQKLRWRLEE